MSDVQKALAKWQKKMDREGKVPSVHYGTHDAFRAGFEAGRKSVPQSARVTKMKPPKRKRLTRDQLEGIVAIIERASQ